MKSVKLLNNACTFIIIFTLPTLPSQEGREVTAEDPQIKSQSTDICVSGGEKTQDTLKNFILQQQVQQSAKTVKYKMKWKVAAKVRINNKPYFQVHKE